MGAARPEVAFVCLNDAAALVMDVFYVDAPLALLLAINAACSTSRVHALP
jgi:hypothetical protein